jgi:periplasmic protein TonB
VSARLGNAARWGACFALALTVHAAGAAALLARWSNDIDLIAKAPVITIELAALPAAPQTQPSDLPPGPAQVEAALAPEPRPDKPIEKVEIKPEPAKQAALTVLPPPKPAAKPKDEKSHRKQASLASAPSTAERKGERAVAPAPGAASRDSYALPNWRSALVAQIERHKRYPGEARARGDHGVAQVAFSVDRHGGLHDARIVRSSGSALLDRDALAWLQRSQPLPPPPPEIHGARISVTVPLSYEIH